MTDYNTSIPGVYTHRNGYIDSLIAKLESSIDPVKRSESIARARKAELDDIKSTNEKNINDIKSYLIAQYLMEGFEERFKILTLLQNEFPEVVFTFDKEVEWAPGIKADFPHLNVTEGFKRRNLFFKIMEYIESILKEHQLIRDIKIYNNEEYNLHYKIYKGVLSCKPLL